MENNLQSAHYENKFNECNARFDATFQLTTAASKIINSDLTILKVNQALTELMGYTAEELVGTRIMDYACEENKHHWHSLQDAMWHKGQPNFKLDVCLHKKDGSLIWVHVTTILFTEEGVPYGYSILDDFTALKKLHESEQRLTMALKYSKMAVWELDLNKRSISFSDGFDELFGYVEGDVSWTEESLLNMFLAEDRLKLKEVLEAIKPGQSFDYQGRIQTAGGVVKWINFQGRAERTQEGKERVLGTLYDITRDKMAERDKDDFISIASHELKTPLTALKGSLQILNLMKDAPTSKLSVLLELANKSMTKVTVLVDDLLNASRITEGQLHLKIGKFNLSNAIDECCLNINLAGNYQILTVGVKDVEVEADSERIQRVIINFINNAIKYAPQSKNVIIGVDELSGNIKVSVTDMGPGIASEKTQHLFDRFYRADENEGQYTGLGLGLYISSEIIKKHGGQIGVDSEPGKGSSFWFTLPSNRLK